MLTFALFLFCLFWNVHEEISLDLTTRRFQCQRNWAIVRKINKLRVLAQRLFTKTY
jgi:hypothetical protein